MIDKRTMAGRVLCCAMIAAVLSAPACRCVPSLADDLLPFLGVSVVPGVVALGIVDLPRGDAPIFVEWIDDGRHVRLVFVSKRRGCRSIQLNGTEAKGMRQLLRDGAWDEIAAAPDGVRLRLWLVETGREVHPSLPTSQGSSGLEVLSREVATSVRWSGMVESLQVKTANGD